MRSSSGERVRIHTQVLDRHDGVYIARFRAYASYKDLEVDVLYKGVHVARSPYKLKGQLTTLCTFFIKSSILPY